MIHSLRTRKQPFVIAYNYRSSALNPSASPKKHRIKKRVITPERTTPKRCRKMTQNLATNRIHEQAEFELSLHSLKSEIELNSPELHGFNILHENYSLNNESDLQKGIPVQLHEVELDEVSGIENSTFRNNCLFEQLICENLKQTPKTN